MDRFTEILEELGELLHTDLRPDVRGVCKLNVHHRLNVQLEHQPDKERLMLASFVCDIPPGKFRENILKDGLKANWPHPINGTLCYSERNNKLALFTFFSTIQFSPQKFHDFLKAFIAKAESWRVAVEAGQTASLIAQTAKSGGNIFGIK